MDTLLSMRWPRSLFGRLCLILCLGLFFAHALSFALSQWERMSFLRNTMYFYLGKDVASAVAILERVPAAERPSWLAQLERPNYQYFLRGAIADSQPASANTIAVQAISAIQSGLKQPHSIQASLLQINQSAQLELHLQLSDQSPLTVRLSAIPWGTPWRMVALLILQLLILAFFCWYAVRMATQPLQHFVEALDSVADKSGLASRPAHAEYVPIEVHRVALAFQEMRARIRAYLSERMQILAAITHDLQTPITRMRLRAELLDDEALKERFLHDLDGMQRLVEQGLQYAKTQNCLAESNLQLQRTDLSALLRSIGHDYLDIGHVMQLSIAAEACAWTDAAALRRILSNLIDNALKFAGAAELSLVLLDQGQCQISIADRGPGISDADKTRVLQPFTRLEESRNRATGGAGLGLAIVQQLSQLLQLEFALHDRPGGGLVASLKFRMV